MVRRPAFTAAWGLLLSACALDMGGLGAAQLADEGGAPAPTEDAATADQSIATPEGVEAGEDTGSAETSGSGNDTSTPVVDAVAPVDADDGDDSSSTGFVCDG